MRTRGLSGVPPKRRATRFRVARLFRTRAAYRIEAVGSLDSALFINTKDCSIDWRLEIQAEYVDAASGVVDLPPIATLRWQPRG